MAVRQDRGLAEGLPGRQVLVVRVATPVMAAMAAAQQAIHHQTVITAIQVDQAQAAVAAVVAVALEAAASMARAVLEAQSVCAALALVVPVVPPVRGLLQ